MNVCFFFRSLIICSNIFLVKRVHFLRARALRNRWNEEHVLLSYEMQWTVRFFLNKSKKWKVGADTSGISRGAKAYALRQESRWKRMAVESDKIFKNTSFQYVTPII